MLSDKAMRILKVLMMHNDTPITAKMLGVMLEMSERSVNMYLKEVADFCRDHQIKYVSKRGSGVYLDSNESSKEMLENLAGRELAYYDSGTRIEYMIQTLLQGWSQYTVALFAEELYVSKNVISSDLNAVKAWLKRHDINLVRKSKLGICLDGGEIQYRSALVDFQRMRTFAEQREQSDLYDCRLSYTDIQRLEHYYGRDLLNAICQGIGLFEHKIEADMVDYSFLMMVEYLCIQQKRMEQGLFTEIREFHFERLNDTLEAAMGQLAISLEAVLECEYLPGERNYLAMLITGAEFQQKKFLQENVKTVCEEILTYLSDLTGLDFFSDQALYEGLNSFLHPCIVRTRYQLEIINPFLDDIKKSYGAIFTACFSLGNYIKKDTKRMPSEHEIAFLTLLVGGALNRIEKKINAVLVGAGSLLLADMMAGKLEEHMTGLRVTSILTTNSLEQLEQLEYDLLITTLPDFKADCPVAYVSPVLDDRDLIRLRKTCNALYTDKLGNADTVKLTDYIRPEFILLDVDAMAKEKLIETGCRVLEEQEFVTKDYYQEILYRETISTTEIGNGVAIPHGIENSVVAPAIFMLRLKNKIDWGNAPVDIIFMLALNFNDTETTRSFFKLFYEKVGDKDTVKLIRNAKCVAEVIEILK